MILHADGEERLLASLFRLVLVVSCSGSPSQPQTSLSYSLLFVKVPKNSVFPRWALPTSHSSPGVLLPLRFIVKGSAAISAFSFFFTSRMTNTWAPLCLKPFATNPELWPSVSIPECMTQQTPGCLALSLVNDSLTNSSLVAYVDEICFSAKSHISTCQRSLGLLVNVGDNVSFLHAKGLLN